MTDCTEPSQPWPEQQDGGDAAQPPGTPLVQPEAGYEGLCFDDAPDIPLDAGAAGEGRASEDEDGGEGRDEGREEGEGQEEEECEEVHQGGKERQDAVSLEWLAREVLQFSQGAGEPYLLREAKLV